MAGMFDMIKQAASMKKQMKKIQKELGNKTVEATSSGVTVVAKGDMSIASITFDPAEVDTSRVDRFEKALVTATNNALAAAKKMAGNEMAKMAGGLGGLSDLLG